MPTINVLSKEIYNRISAGEVVERPSSVVKELVENSIDAGATIIKIIIENGGIGSITVCDNGCGIAKSDVEKAFLPHATSKLKLASDLDRIETLGFRGEALASIASVCKVEMTTKTSEEELATQLVINGGEIVSVSPIAGDTGTTIKVTDIFFNTPARLKFLKSERNEKTDVSALVEKLMLANPTIAIHYVVDDDTMYEAFGDGVNNAIVAIYGKNTLDNCIEISTNQNGIQMDGFLGRINFTKANRNFQTIIVNGRAVVDTTVSMAIYNAYSSYLMKRRYPFYVLSLTVPPEIVDVNVHPRKAEIRFQDNRIVYSAIYTTVMKVLDGSSQALEIIRATNTTLLINPNENEFNEERLAAEKEAKKNGGEKKEPTLADLVAADIEKEESEIKRRAYSDLMDENRRIALGSFPEEDYPPKPKKDYSVPYDKDYVPRVKSSSPNVGDIFCAIKADFTDITKIEPPEVIFEKNKDYVERLDVKSYVQQKMVIGTEMNFIGQLFNCYLLFEYQKELLLIDQHAAHERILYDQLLNNVLKKTVQRQQLIVPYSITVSPKEFDMLYDLIDNIRALGIMIEAYKEESFRIFTVPVLLDGIDIESFMADIITDAKFRDEKIPTIINEKLMQKACKSAIKSGDQLSRDEIDELMELLKGDLGLKCPHGRPVCVKVTRAEIDKWFKRIV